LEYGRRGHVRGGQIKAEGEGRGEDKGRRREEGQLRYREWGKCYVMGSWGHRCPCRKRTFPLSIMFC